MKKIILLFLLQFSMLTFAQPGSLDTTFDPGTGADAGIVSMELQPDGKIIIGGAFTTYNGTGINCIARLNKDGSLDTSFNTGTGTSYMVYTTSLQSDGKIIIGGSFPSYNGVFGKGIARLNTDGSLDASFKPGKGSDNVVLSTCIQSDGKIIIGGLFDSYNGIARRCIARLNTDGTLDPSFNPGIGADYRVDAITVQPDGKIIIGGGFASYNGVARSGIARLNTDGSLDTTFTPGTGANNPLCVSLLQPDGKIIIGGQFTIYNGVARGHLARLNMDGSLDTSFNPGMGANNTIVAISMLPDGKLIVGGQFTAYNGVPKNQIALLNANGSLDLSFDPGTGIGNYIHIADCRVQPDGKIIIVGIFNTYNGVSRNHVARINNELLPPVAVAQSFCYTGTVGNLVATGMNLKWYTSASGGSSLASTTVINTGTYYVSQTVGDIESGRTAVPVIINSPVVPTFTQVNAICQG